MATLVSPGVSVTVVDQSQYLPAPTNSVPLIVLATAQNKADPTSTAVASGTTAANAGKLYEVTSQRDLVTLYGNPFFYTTSNGTPIQGYELNEYGLLAAYSALGVTNRVYTLRADIDLASLVGQTGRPTGRPANGTYWLDTTTSTWGLYEFNQTTGKFVLQSPIVITDSAFVSAGYPVNSLGNIGDYAVIATPTYAYPTATNAGMFFKKDSTNNWRRLGGSNWMKSQPTVQGSNSNPSLTAGNTFTITVDSGISHTITVQNSPNNVVSLIANQINSLGYGYLSAGVVSGKLVIYSAQTGQSQNPTPTAPPKIVIGAGSGTVLSDLGITAGTYYQPQFVYGTSANQPLWQSGQTYPAPTGSVWVKIGEAGNGLTSSIKEWNDATANWESKTVSYATSDAAAIAAIDATGGAAIPAGTVYTQYAFGGTSNNIAPLYYWERIASGATIVTASSTPSFINGPYTANVTVSIPGSSSYSSSYPLTLGTNITAGNFVVGTRYTITSVGNTNFTLIGAASNTVGVTFTATGVGSGTGTAFPTGSVTATSFVTAWSAAGIPFTTAQVLDTGEIQLIHTQGGVIVVDDINTITGYSCGLMADAGFVIGSTLGVKEGQPPVLNFTPLQASTSGGGSGLSVYVTTNGRYYNVTTTTFPVAGTGYVVGDTVTFSGATLGGTSPANDLVVKVAATNLSTAVTAIEVVSGTAGASYPTQLSNWVEFNMTANAGAPVDMPSDGTDWFYSVVDQVDIMVRGQSGWLGYKQTNYDQNGMPISGVNATDPNGPIVSASMPTTQSDGSALVYGDIWIDTSDLENYPLISRWQEVNNKDMWVLVDNTDSVNPNGIVFADARWSTNQSTINAYNDPLSTIKSLLSSNNTDLDAPDYTLYPVGMLLFNTRRSGYNVKQWQGDYFNSIRFPDMSIPTNTGTWVSVSGLEANGAPYMGRKAQRNMVVKAMRAAIDTNSAIRDEDNAFNLIATPNYPELQPNMVVLNNDRGNTGFIVGDTPMRLPATATAVQAWATNAAGAATTGDEGCVTRDTYLGLFYPSGLTSDLNGNLVAVPPSHMMIRTILRNDTVAYPWFAPAGTRRGLIDNATNIGYIDAMTGEFITIKTSQGLRDVLYINEINPLVFFTGNGLLNYGNKTSYASQSALDRINVARLIAYIRRQLTLAARPFVFEPNDKITREQITAVIQSLFVDLVAKRGVYDFLVVCDESNNTPARIDRNELWVDVAIEPVKAIEFIYIPVRVLNTGAIGNNNG